MTGGQGDQRGITPRVIEEIFGNIEKSKGNLEVLQPIAGPEGLEYYKLRNTRLDSSTCVTMCTCPIYVQYVRAPSHHPYRRL